MITRLLLLAMLLPLAGLSQVQAQADGRYIEVTGTSEIEIVPDRIHYIIEIREYFEEEFDGRSETGGISYKDLFGPDRTGTAGSAA